jgi:hypothetical protein
MPRGFIRVLAPVAAALAASVMAVPACATETSFATFTGLGVSFMATNDGTTMTLTDSSVVNFGFLATNLTTAISSIPANVVFTATSADTNVNSAFAAQGVAYQTGFSGTVTFTSTQAFTVGSSYYAAGSNLLKATFTNASFLGVIGQQNAGLTADSTTGTLVYTSDFLDFSDTVSRDYSLSFGAINPKLSTSGSPAYINGFTSTPTGSFASDPVPLSTADVPEPASWAMMLVGFGAIGLGLRSSTRRRLRAA